MKKCIECGNEFQEKYSGGQEQKYCSKECRVKAAYKRRESNMAERLKREIQQEPAQRDEPTKLGSAYQRTPEDNVRQYSEKSFGISNEKMFTLISDNAYLTAENKRLNDKIETLQIENGKLLAELDKYEEDEEEGDNDSMGSVIDKYAPLILPALASYLAPKQHNTTTNGQPQTAPRHPKG